MAAEQSFIERFSTAALPERDRLPMYIEAFGRCVANMDITPLDGQCWAQVETLTLPGADVTWGSNSPERCQWGAAQGKSDDDCLLVWATSCAVVRHLSREITVGAGPAVVLSCAEKGVVEHPLPIEHVTLKCSRAALKSLLPGVENTFMRLIDVDNDALRLLKSYLPTVRVCAETASVELRCAMTLHLHDLIALALNPTRDVAQFLGKRGLAAARLDAMKKHTLEQASNPSFSVDDVARAQSVTPRYVQVLFEKEGMTFSTFLLQTRLALAHRRLSNPASAFQSIISIAMNCGFNNLSHFNLSFRRAYGQTPSDVRKRARERR